MNNVRIQIPMIDNIALKTSTLLYPKDIFESGGFLAQAIPMTPMTKVKLSVIKWAASLIIAKDPAM